MIATMLLLATAPTGTAGTAEQRTVATIARVRSIDPSIHAFIALDPIVEPLPAVDGRRSPKA